MDLSQGRVRTVFIDKMLSFFRRADINLNIVFTFTLFISSKFEDDLIKVRNAETKFANFTTSTRVAFCSLTLTIMRKTSSMFKKAVTTRLKEHS